MVGDAKWAEEFNSKGTVSKVSIFGLLNPTLSPS